jgi:hypothetical protein
LKYVIEHLQKANKRAIAWQNQRDDKVVAVRERVARVIDAMETSLKEEKVKLDQMLASPFKNAELVRAHTTKVTNIVKCMSLVLLDPSGGVDGSSETLNDFIEIFKKREQDGKAVRPSTGASSSGRRELGMGPPCLKYETLVSVSDWRTLLQEILEVGSPEDCRIVFIHFATSVSPDIAMTR